MLINMWNFVYWILVPLLPLSGFILGAWLNSSPMPDWQVPLGKDDVLVRISKDDSFVLLAEVTPNGVIAFKGIDLIHGRQAFRSQVHQPGSNRRMYLKNQVMTDDDMSVLLNLRDTDAVEATERYQLVRYDLQLQQIVQRFLPTRHNLVFHESCMSNSVLMTVGEFETRGPENGLNDVCNLYFWDLRSTALITEIPCKSIPLQIGLSYDGSMAHVISYVNQKSQLELYDVRDKSRVQLIPGDVMKVVWARDRHSFLALENLSSPRTCQIHRYQQRDGSSFVLEWTRELNDLYFVDAMGSGSAYLIGSVKSIESSWRSNIHEWCGEHLDFVLNRLWPESQNWQIIDKETGNVVHRISSIREDAGQPFPLNNGRGYLFFCHKSMEYWDMYPFSRWYPLLGLAVGILLAMLLSWRLLRLRPNPKQTPPVIREVVAP